MLLFTNFEYIITSWAECPINYFFLSLASTPLEGTKDTKTLLIKTN